MKICPFISHMIGEDGTNVLEIVPEAAGNSDVASSKQKAGGSGVVILGYDGEGGVGLKEPKTGSRSKASAKSRAASSDAQSHLFCLKETCRFYQKGSGECMFDQIFETVESQSKTLAKSEKKSTGDKTAATVTKELDKFWKFQTKSVSELIASIGDAEKNQSKSLEDLRKELDKRLNALPAPDDGKDVADLRKQIDDLHEAIESRSESMENFSTTVSELIVNIEDSLKALRDESNGISSRIDGIKDASPDPEAIEKRVERAIERQLEKAPQKDVSEDVRSLAEDVREFVSSTKKLEERVATWQDQIESRVDEIRGSQEAWQSRLDAIDKAQHELLEAVSAQKDTRNENENRGNRREAKKLNNLGVTSFHNGELELARDQFLQAVALDNQFAEAYNNLGLVYTEIGQEDDAAAAFSRAIDINPDLHAAYNNLGYAFYRQGNYEQAVEMYNEALGRSASNSSAYTNLGNAYYKMGRRDEAREAWEKALDLDPGNEKASRNLRRLERE